MFLLVKVIVSPTLTTPSTVSEPPVADSNTYGDGTNVSVAFTLTPALMSLKV